MASGTVSRYFETADPTMEVFLVEDMADGNNLTSRKFGNIAAGHITGISSGSCALSFSGTEATVIASGVTSGTFTVTLWGD